MAKPDPSTACAEHSSWTPLPLPPPAETTLELARIDPSGAARIAASGRLSFHLTGCSGNDRPGNTRAVAKAMAKQSETAFLYHLGDVIYSDDDQPQSQRKAFNRQFLDPYSRYPAPIVAIAGNHDGKQAPSRKRAAVHGFLANFCADPNGWPAPWPKNTIDRRPAMIQPYPYWRFDSPLASIIGLYANVGNGGILDDPGAHPDFTTGPQYRWLVEQLAALKRRDNVEGPRAVLLTVHYPPYAGTTNFDVRGDQWIGSTPTRMNAPHLGTVIQRAFAESGRRADAIFSAHAHLYQRLTYAYPDGTVLPCVIAGSGGHSLERMFTRCNGRAAETKTVPFAAVTPNRFSFPPGESATVDAYTDADLVTGPTGTRTDGSYGFVRVDIEGRRLTTTFFGTSGKAGDTFTLDLDTHRYVPAA